MTMLWFPLLLTTLAAVYDLRQREIPDWIPVALLFGAAGAVGAGWIVVGPWLAVAGCTLAFALSATLFWLGGWGGGDVKLLTAIGAWLGPAALLGMCFWMALAGAGLAMFAWSRGRKDLAYAPAIACGLMVQTAWPDVVRHWAGL